MIHNIDSILKMKLKNLTGDVYVLSPPNVGIDYSVMMFLQWKFLNEEKREKKKKLKNYRERTHTLTHVWDKKEKEREREIEQNC